MKSVLKKLTDKVLEALKDLAAGLFAPQPVPVRVRATSRTRRFYPK
jgi:hypothetical protein